MTPALCPSLRGSTFMRQVRRFGVFQTAKVLGILYALGGLLIAPFLVLASMFGGEANPFGMSFALLIPIFYGVLGFVTTAVGALIYNTVAGWVGGIEIETIETAASFE
jgi:hypothetical protein